MYADGYDPLILNISEEQRRYVEKHNFYRSRSGTTRVYKDFDVIKTGLVGEVVFCDYLGCPRPTIGMRGDKGYDIDYSGLKFDVKTTTSTPPRLRLDERALRKDADNYVLLACSGNTVEIVGKISKKKFNDIKKRYKFRKWETYYCDEENLEEWN